MKTTVEIEIKELIRLRKVEQAHEDYLAAIRVVEKRHARLRFDLARKPVEDETATTFARGYAQAIQDLSDATADVLGVRISEATMVRAAQSPDVQHRAVS